MKQSLSNVIFEDLYNKIKTDFYSVGDLLPTEKEMQEIYGVSRSPVRMALAALENEGFIIRKPGIGTKVAENTIFSHWTPMGGFVDKFRNSEGKLECNTIDVSKTIIDKEISDELNIPNNQPVIQVIRVRKENDAPIFLLKHYYIDVDMQKIKEAGDILYMRQFASHVLGINFEYVSEQLTAVKADQQLSYHLGLELNSPLLKVKRTSYDKKYNPVEYVEYYVNTENWPYKVVFSKDGSDFDF